MCPNPERFSGADFSLSPGNRALGYDVGDQIVLKRGDLVLQPQLAFFEPGDLQLICRTGVFERVDSRIEIAMLDLQRLKALAHFFFSHA